MGTCISKSPLLNLKGILILDAILLSTVIFATFFSKLLLSLQVRCMIEQMGYLCPSCGGTRAVFYLFRGQIFMAYGMNAYFTLSAFAICFGVILLHITCFWKKPILCKISKGLIHPYTAVLWTVGFIIFGIVRNLI